MGVFEKLEEQMCSYVPDDKNRKKSPDRMDALVFAVTALMLGETPADAGKGDFKSPRYQFADDISSDSQWADDWNGWMPEK